MRALALLVALLVAAGCSSAADTRSGALDPAATSTTSEGPATSGDPGTVPSQGGDTTVPSAGGPPVTDPAGPTGGGPTSTPTTQASAPAPGAVGAFGPFYLRADGAASILVDVHVQSGAEPRSQSLARLTSTLETFGAKPVELRSRSLPGSGGSWTADQIRALADDVSPSQTRDVAVVTVLFLRGGFAESDTALGVAVRSDVVAIFADRVTEGAGLVGDRSRVEMAVTVHELGHLLGLVDLAIDTGRDDPEHPGHSPSRDSVMYYAVESTLVGSLLSGGPPVEFDAADRADLRAIAGR